MASWVAPAVAAELWGMSLEEVLIRVANGSIPSRMEGQFTFVAIGTAATHRNPSLPEEPIITPEERAALSDHEDEGDGPSLDLSQWRLARFQASLIRRPPVRAAV
jgi:hypothetical protein